MRVRSCFRSSVLLVLAIVAVSTAGAREFTDAKGRKIRAELVAHAGDSVIISSGGKEFTIKVKTLSLDDQAFIANWIKENPDAMRFNFRYFVDLDQGIKKNAKVDYDERLQTIPMEYSISVSNQSPGPLEGATIKCLVFVEDFVDTRNNRFRSLNSGEKPRSGRNQRLLATVPVDSLRSDGRADIDFIVPIHYYVDRDGGRVDNAVKDEVLGVWIRVYRGNKMIAERIEPENRKKMEEAQWSEKGAEALKPKVNLK